MSNIGSSNQQRVGILGQLLSNQSTVFPPPTLFFQVRNFLPNLYGRDFLPNGQPTSNSTLVEPKASSEESDDVNEEQSQKTTIFKLSFTVVKICNRDYVVSQCGQIAVRTASS